MQKGKILKIDKKIDQTISEIKNNARPGDDDLINLLEELKTHYRQSEPELHSIYKEIFHHSPIPLAFFEKSSDGNDFIIFDLNDACIGREGISKENAVGKKIREVFGDRITGQVVDAMENVWATGKDQTIVYKLEDENGSPVWFESKLFMIPSGKIFFSSFDITERKKIEEYLKDSERKYSSLFDNPKLIMLVIDFNTQMIVDANNGAETFYGWSKDEFVKLNINQINLLEPEEIKRKMREAKERHLPYFEFKHRKKNNEEVFVAVFKGENFILNGREVFYIIVLDITERKITEDLLFATLYSIGDAVISTDTEGCVRMMNHVAEKLTGWKEAEAKGKRLDQVFNVINCDTRKKVESPAEKVINSGNIISISSDTLLISRDGVEIPISDSGAPIKDSDGNIEGVILVFRDNTQELEAKQLINESKARLNRAELASLSGNWELDLTSGKIIGSEGAQKIYGLKGELFDYEDVKQIPLPEYREKLDKALKDLLGKNKPYDLEIKIKASDSGKIKDIHTTAFYEKEKNIIYGVIQDITKRKKAEESLIESERRYRTLFNFGPDAIFIHPFDDSGFKKFIEVNKIACEWLGYDREELLTMSVKDIAKEKDAIIRETSIGRKELLETGKMVFEAELIGKSGEKIPVEIYTTLIEYKSVKSFFSVARNISERKKSEIALKERMVELERFNKVMVGRELRIISLKKEINTLLKKLGEPKKFKIN